MIKNKESTMEEKQKTYGIKAIDKIGYAFGDMGGVLTLSLIHI